MGQISINGTTQNPQKSFHFDPPGAELEAPGQARRREPDFAELHDSFEIQYQQFLTDTSHEIAKSAQRLLELNSIIYGDSRSGGIPHRHHIRAALAYRQGA